MLKRGCYAHEKSIPNSKAWVAVSKQERAQIFSFRNQVKKINKAVWPVGMERGTKLMLSTI